MSSSREKLIEALAPGNEYMGCILHDARVWLTVIKPSIPREKAIQFLVNRIYTELADEADPSV